jgi:hypothetical protein
MPKCIACKTKEAAFNLEGKTNRLYCSKCKTDDMINVKHKMCIVCKKTIANYNYDNEECALYCVKCKTDDMVNINSKKCIKCKKKRAYYNYKGENNELYCGECKLDNMILLKPRNCIKCNTLSATFNFVGETKRLYCSKCKTDDMEDVRHQKCKNLRCNITLSYGNKYEGYCVQCYTRKYPERPILKNYKPKEIGVSNFIKNVFSNHNLKLDKKFGNSKKRPDISLIFSTHVIIVEVDEYQHKHYVKKNESERTEKLLNENDKPIVIIRFNPDGYINSKKNKIKSCWSYDEETKLTTIKNKDDWNNRLFTLQEKIEYWCSNIPENMFQIVYLFYDGYDQ